MYKEEEIIKLLKRIETKLSHGFDAQGINITDKPLKDNVLSKIFIERHEDSEVIRVLHDDVTIGNLKEYLEDKVGTFYIVSGDFTCKIQTI